MMKTGFLPQKSNTGFTMIPNNCIDAILRDDAEDAKVADNLSVALFLLRHLPGQQGKVRLAFDFSQPAICESLGWGRTNIKRLRRAIKSLERLGLLSIEVQNNNLLTLAIDASLGRKEQPSHNKGCVEVAPMRQGSLENPSPAGREDFSRPLINKEEEIYLRNHHQEKSDELSEIFEAYRNTFKLPIPAKHQQNFADQFARSGLKKAAILRLLEDIAAHPFMRHEITSINAVFHFAYLKSRAKLFERNLHEAIEHLRRQDNDSEALRFRDSIEAQGYSFEEISRWIGFDPIKVAA